MTPSLKDTIERLEQIADTQPSSPHKEMQERIEADEAMFRHAAELLDQLRWRDVEELPDSEGLYIIDVGFSDQKPMWYDYMCSLYRDSKFQVHDHIPIRRWRPIGPEVNSDE